VSQRASLTSAALSANSPPTYSAIHQWSLKVPRVETFSQTFRIGRTAKPTSSIASRTTAASWLSPGSTSPLTMPSASDACRPLNEQNLLPFCDHRDDGVEHEFDRFVSVPDVFSLLEREHSTANKMGY
jgi:hypothetical protein